MSTQPVTAGKKATRIKLPNWLGNYHFWIYSYFIIITLANIFWLARSSLGLMSESVIYQDQVIQTFSKLQHQQSWLNYYLGRYVASWRAPLIQDLALHFRTFCNGQWPFFWTQWIFLLGGTIAAERLGTLLYNERVGFVTAILTLSSFKIEEALRTFTPDFPLMMILALIVYVYCKSEHLSTTKSQWLCTGLIILGTLIKWSFIPVYLSIALLIAARAFLRNWRDKHRWRRLGTMVLVGAIALVLLYSQVFNFVGNNYQYNRNMSPISRTESQTGFLAPMFQWCNLVNITTFTIDGDMLPILGKLFLFCSLLVCCCPRRFRPSLYLLWIFIVPPYFMLSNFFLFLPRYTLPLLCFQMLLVASVLDKVHRYLRLSLVILAVVAKIIFIEGWVFSWPVAISDNCYLYSDIVGLNYSIGTHDRKRIMPWQHLAHRLLDCSSKWSPHFFFTAPPVTYTWEQSLREQVKDVKPESKIVTLCSDDLTHPSLCYFLRCALADIGNYKTEVHRLTRQDEVGVQTSSGDYLFIMLPLHNVTPERLAKFKANRSLRWLGCRHFLGEGWHPISAVGFFGISTMRDTFARPFDILIWQRLPSTSHSASDRERFESTSNGQEGRSPSARKR